MARPRELVPSEAQGTEDLRRQGAARAHGAAAGLRGNCQGARQAGETVAKGISMTALGAFGMLLINLVGSLLGALAASRRSEREIATVERVA